ncbi:MULTISPECIES: hypothetical protein [Rhodonellum]|uniref:hypothetical protein n=1 Tax=Rhodonellum TaxID=336827 RepID=UPI001114365C|nr:MULTISPECIES: hypothetical protein [Rhodonellum]
MSIILNEIKIAVESNTFSPKNKIHDTIRTLKETTVVQRCVFLKFIINLLNKIIFWRFNIIMSMLNPQKIIYILGATPLHEAIEATLIANPPAATKRTPPGTAAAKVKDAKPQPLTARPVTPSKLSQL